MDDRGQAVVLGAVLLFGIVTIAFAGYQAYQVPNQNAQTEFQHFEEAKDQMVQLRSAASDTAAVSQPRSVTFPLGTSFQQRSFAVNPPPPTGELATSEAHTITIYNSAGTVTDTVEARLLTYDPNYREYQPGVLRYEHGIVYLDARDVGGGVVFLEEYTAPLRLVPIQNEFGASGQRQIGLELYRPEGTDQIKLSPDDTVRIPTRLPDPDESDWDETLGVSVTGYDPGDPNRVSLRGDDISNIIPVGINQPPEANRSTEDFGSSPASDTPRFTALNAVAGPSNPGVDNKEVKVEWNIAGEFTTVRFSTSNDQNSFDNSSENRQRTIENGTELSFDQAGNGDELTATVTSSDGQQQCTATVSNNDELSLDDFDCSS